jgi:hypothetical protein
MPERPNPGQEYAEQFTAPQETAPTNQEISKEKIDQLINHAGDLSGEIKTLSDQNYEKIHDEAKKREIKAKLAKVLWSVGSASAMVTGAALTPVRLVFSELGLDYTQPLEQFVSNPNLTFISIPVLATGLFSLFKAMVASHKHEISEKRLGEIEESR